MIIPSNYLVCDGVLSLASLPVASDFRRAQTHLVGISRYFLLAEWF